MAADSVLIPIVNGIGELEVSVDPIGYEYDIAILDQYLARRRRVCNDCERAYTESVSRIIAARAIARSIDNLAAAIEQHTEVTLEFLDVVRHKETSSPQPTLAEPIIKEEIILPPRPKAGGASEAEK